MSVLLGQAAEAQPYYRQLNPGYAPAVAQPLYRGTARGTTQPAQPAPPPAAPHSPAPGASPNRAPKHGAPAASADDTKPQDPSASAWSGSVEAGFLYATGNTETRDANAATTLGYTTDSWENTLRLKLVNREENNEQTEEEYRVEGRTQYLFSAKDYLFGELNYVDDRFSGFDYRITEVVGYGRKWFNSKRFKWDSSVGAGLRQSKSQDADSTNDPLARLGNNIVWHINERLSLENHIEADISDLTTLYTQTALKSKLTGALFLKFGVDTEYLSDVPASNNNLDTDVYLNVAYEY